VQYIRIEYGGDSDDVCMKLRHWCGGRGGGEKKDRNREVGVDISSMNPIAVSCPGRGWIKDGLT